MIKGWLGGVRNNLDAIGFGSAVPELRDRIFDVIAPREDKGVAGKLAQEQEDERIRSGTRARRRAGRAGFGQGMAKGGVAKKAKPSKNAKAKSSASKRGDGIARHGKTRGRMV